MTLIFCLDNNNGMLFAGKRQSRDRVVCEKVLEISTGAVLRMSPYSAKLFPETSQIVAEVDFLRNAGKGACCFVEDYDYLPFMDSVSRIILFKWNRDYPADRYFSYDLSANGYSLTSTELFSGHSHDEVTMEVYER